MANSDITNLTTPTLSLSSWRNQPIQTKTQSKMQQPQSKDQVNAAESASRFKAYNRLQAAAVAFGENLPMPEIVAIGGQSDGKSSLLEALLGFRFNVREVEIGTRRPLILQMVHDSTALEPRCRFQDEDSDEYGSPVVSATALADVIRSRTEALLKKTNTAVSPKPIVMRAEYAHCPNLTIIDTPGFIRKASNGEPETTPDDILSMVKSLASPPHRILLFLQQSSVEWCSSLWLDAVREIDPSFLRTIVVVSKFDNRLKEFSDRAEVDRYLSASGYLGESTRPYFVALPKDRSTVSNDEFRRQISLVDSEVLRHLQEGVQGGFDEDKFRSYIGFGSLRDFLESEIQRRLKEAAPATVALLEQRCYEIQSQILSLEMKIQCFSNIPHLRKEAMLYIASFCKNLEALLDGSSNPEPEQWGRTTAEERLQTSRGWPHVQLDPNPPNSSLKLYGGAAFERLLHEFHSACYSINCPPLSREKVANILLAHTGREGVTEASAEIGRTAARSWLAPLLDTACDRLAFVLGSAFDIALERRAAQNSDDEKKIETMDGYVGFHAALRNCYSCFVQNLAKQCKQLLRQQLDSVTSPYSMACYENNYHQRIAFGSYNMYNQASGHWFCLDLSDASHDKAIEYQENIPAEKNNGRETTPGGGESHLIVPETPSPEQPREILYGLVNRKVGNGPCGLRGIKRTATMAGIGMQSASAYSEICSLAAQHFSRIRQALVKRVVPSTLKSGFLTPCRDRLVVSLAVELFAVNDESFMLMFVAPGAMEALQNERQQLLQRLNSCQSILSEFKSL